MPTAAPGSDFDMVRFSRDFRRLSDEFEAVKAIVGYTGSVIIPPDYLSGFCASLDVSGSDVPTDSDGTYSFGTSLEIPAGKLAIGARVAIDFMFEARPQSFPWAFQVEIHNGGDVHPAADFETIATDPTAPALFGCVRFVGTVRGTVGAVELVPDSVCCWNFSGGSTGRWEGVSVNSVLTGSLPIFDEALAFTVAPALALTGCTAGDTIKLHTLSIVVTQPSPTVS